MSERPNTIEEWAKQRNISGKIYKTNKSGWNYAVVSTQNNFIVIKYSQSKTVFIRDMLAVKTDDMPHLIEVLQQAYKDRLKEILQNLARQTGVKVVLE